MENGTVSSNKLPQPGDQVSSLSNYASNGRIMLFSGVFLFAAIILVLFFHSSARWIFHLRRRRRRYVLSLSANDVATKGLDPSILKALPVLIYSTKTHAPPLECAVCLSEFQDGEEGRVLPACKHTFHSCCIDMWFCSHSNCPLCRSPVQSGACKARAETVIPVAEAADLRRKEGSATATLSPQQCEKIGPDLVGILVERPTTIGPGPLSQDEPKPSCEKVGLDL